MTYQTLYRKYRPKKFELVYGQDSIVKTLKNSIKKGMIGHAYLFTGPRGTGKTSCAKLFAKVVNCLNNDNGDACNECENCVSFNNNSNPDIIEIDAASNNGVDEIRELKSKITLVPSMSKYKVYIIDEVHMLSIGAFNALLKTLEEPPEYVIFILATTEPQKIPNTVISRCQRYDFKSISSSEMRKCLENIANSEKINIEDDAIEEIIINSEGGLRDAIGLLDQARVYCDEKILASDIQLLSGNLSNNEISDFLNCIIEKKYTEIIKKVDFYEQSGKDFKLISQKILMYLHEILIRQKTKKFNKDDINIKEPKLNEKDIYAMIDVFNEIISNLKISNQKKLIFEVKIIQFIDDLKKEEKVIETGNIKETDFKISDNVSRETLLDVHKKEPDNDLNNELTNYREKLKKIRINNILLKSTKDDIDFIKNLWQNIADFLSNEDLCGYASLLMEGNPVAASSDGIIIIFPVESILKKIEQNYEISGKILHKIYNNDYKVVYLTENNWKEIRPYYAEKVKKKELKYLDESDLIDKIKKIEENNSVNDFEELIEMEDRS